MEVEFGWVHTDPVLGGWDSFYPPQPGEGMGVGKDSHADVELMAARCRATEAGSDKPANDRLKPGTCTSILTGSCARRASGSDSGS